MPNIKSAKKRVKQSEKRRLRNNARSSALKTSIKKLMTLLESKNVEEAKTQLKDIQAKLSRAKSKGLLHANAASRKISSLAKRVSQASR